MFVRVTIMLLVFCATANAQLPNRVVDLRETPTVRKIESTISRILPGNQSRATIDRFEFSTNPLEIRGSLTVRGAHSWGRVNVPNPTVTNPFGVRSVEVAADRSATAIFRYNLRDNKVSGTLSIPLGRIGVTVAGQNYSKDLGTVRLNFDEIEQVIDGDWDILLTKIPNFGVISRDHRNELRDIRESYEARYGKDNIYFASPEFVRWASPERLGKWAAVGVITGGANLKGVMKQVQKKALEEGVQVRDWLQKRGLQQAKETAIALLSGNHVEFPYMALKWQTVKYESRVEVGGRPISPWVAVRHGAFVIIWTNKTNNTAGNNSGGNSSNTRIAVGTTHSGRLSSSDPRTNDNKYYQTYAVDLRAGENYVIDVKGSFDTYLILLDGNTKLQYNDDYNNDTNHSRITFRPSSSKTYRVVVTSFRERATGSFQVNVSGQSTAGTNPGNNNSPIRIAAGSSRSGNLSSSDARSSKGKYFDTYLLDMVAGYSYTIDLTGDFDTYLLLHHNNAQVAYNDDFNSTRQSRMSYTAKQSGTYEIVVTSFSANEVGNYRLTIGTGSSTVTNNGSKNTPTKSSNQVIPLSMNSTARGTISNSDRSWRGKHADVYGIIVHPGYTYTVELRGSFDTFVAVFDGAREIGSNDDYNGSTNHSRFSFIARSSGQYLVFASSYTENQAGSYSLTVTKSGGSTKSNSGSSTGTNSKSSVRTFLTNGVLARTDSRNDKGKYYDVHRVYLQAGHTYSIDLRASFDTYLVLQTDSGSTIATDDDGGDGTNSRIRYRPDRSGYYRVIATSYPQNQTGSYMLSAR